MKTIKYFIYLIIFCFFFYEAKSQYAIAGIQGSIYVNIIPDTLLNPAPCLCVAEEYYSIDINQDGINDIKIDAYTANSSGHTDESISISSLDTNTRFSFWKTDSVYHSGSCGGPTWSTSGILKPYNMGDTIKNGNYVTSDYLCIYNVIGSCTPPYFYNSSEWVDSTDHYIGVKYTGITGISYGWVRVNVTNYYTVLIKDFTLGIPLNGIEQITGSNEQVMVYPNPAVNNLQVIYTGNSKVQEITLCDVLGKEVLNTKEKDIDVSNLQEGVYFVSVKTNERVLTKKIIIQR